jgi:dTDP-4-dehydrorhamnose reductase
VTGAHGQLGRQLCRLLGPCAIALDADQMDLTNSDQIRQRLGQLKPQLLINCAAYTAVDAAEADAARCFAVNRDAVRTLVDVTGAMDCPLVQLSTDYVFGGDQQRRQPYRETDPIAPQGVYARSKAEGELAAQTHPHHLIVRTCGLYGPSAPGASGNFVNTIMRLGREREVVRVVDDQFCCPTYVVELAQAIVYLVGTAQRGIFHVVNSPGLTWYQMACEIARLASLPCRVVPITTQEYNAAAPRPRFSALDTSKYRSCGGPPMLTCRQALARYLAV